MAPLAQEPRVRAVPHPMWSSSAAKNPILTLAVPSGGLPEGAVRGFRDAGAGRLQGSKAKHPHSCTSELSFFAEMFPGPHLGGMVGTDLIRNFSKVFLSY